MKPFADVISHDNNLDTVFDLAEDSRFTTRRFRSRETAARFLNVAANDKREGLREPLIKAVTAFINDNPAYIEYLLAGLDNIKLMNIIRTEGLSSKPKLKEDRFQEVWKAVQNDNISIPKALGYVFMNVDGKMDSQPQPAPEVKVDVDSVVEKLRPVVEDKLTELDMEQLAKEALKKATDSYRKIEIKVGKSKSVKMDEVLPEYFEKLVKLAQARVNTLMVGPAGCGKTFIASKVAKALGLKFAAQSCSEGISESYFTGWLLPIDNGNFVHVASEFIAMYEKGGVFLFDEIDASDPNLLVFMNQALANDGFYLPQRHKKPFVKKHKNFHAIAAANTFGNGADAEYVGRNQLDAATLDRFRMGTVKMDYSEQVERKIIEEVNPEVYQWGTNVRRIIRKHNMRRIMSTRNMQDAVRAMSAGLTLDELKESYFNDWSPADLQVIKMEGGMAA